MTKPAIGTYMIKNKIKNTGKAIITCALCFHVFSRKLFIIHFSFSFILLMHMHPTDTCNSPYFVPSIRAAVMRPFKILPLIKFG